MCSLLKDVQGYTGTLKIIAMHNNKDEDDFADVRSCSGELSSSLGSLSIRFVWSRERPATFMAQNQRITLFYFTFPRFLFTFDLEVSLHVLLFCFFCDACFN